MKTYFKTNVLKAKPLSVDREGGYAKAGIIKGVSAITKGEALGHGMWIDDDTVIKTAYGINQSEKGVKVRFTHPGMCSDGTGKFVGRMMNARVENGKAIADLHISETARNEQGTGLGDYVLNMAEKESDMAGMSIVFTRDLEAEEEFTKLNIGANGEFKSPDEANSTSLPHARLKELHAVDFVDEPAANPDGMYSASNSKLYSEAKEAMGYVLGLSENKPTIENLGIGIDLEQAREFVKLHLQACGYNIIKEDKNMSENTEKQAEKQLTEAEKPAENVGQVTSEPVAEKEPATPEEKPAPEQEATITTSASVALNQNVVAVMYFV